MALLGQTGETGVRRRPWFSWHLAAVAGQIALGFFVYGAHDFFPGLGLAAIPFFTDEYHPVHWVLSLLPSIYAARFLGSRYALWAAAAVGAAYALYAVLFHISIVDFFAIIAILSLGFLLSGLSRLEELEWRAVELAHEALREHAAAVERQAEHLAALGSLAAAVSQSLDIATVTGRALEVALPALKAQFGLVHLHHAETETLILSAYRGWTPEQARQVNLMTTTEGWLARVARGEETVQLVDFAADQSPLGRLLHEAGVACFAAAPIVEEGKVLGVFSTACTPPGGCSDETLALLRTMGHQLGAAIANARRYDDVERQSTQATALARVLQEDMGKLERVQKEGLESLKRALANAHPAVTEHSRRVRRLALAMAQELGLSEGERELLAQAAEFHDIGLLGVPAAVLGGGGAGSGPGDTGGQAIRQRIVAGVDLLRPLGFPSEGQALVRSYQEHWDGTGHPDGLAGEQIPPLARLLAVADRYERLVGSRPLPPPEARARLQAGAGSRWEPRMVDALLRALDKDPTLAILSGGESPGAPRPA